MKAAAAAAGWKMGREGARNGICHPHASCATALLLKGNMQMSLDGFLAKQIVNKVRT